MQSILAHLTEHAWLWEEPRNTVWSTLAVGVLGYLAEKALRLTIRLAKKLHSQASQNQWGIRAIARGFARRELMWTRKHRRDEVWISREVSRGHASLIIFLLWFGFWAIAVGMKESLYLTKGPLITSPMVTIVIALPMYLFEVLWIRHSGRAAKIIKYRKVRIWRWH
ncbi:hypothetical protein [Pseudomonas sp. RIT411]|uniref:hypothetical protein n=1 Tax=Pseudomonas sp. RIT411 TaxID=2202160 RepID=UPI000D3868A8|nr:hypothetical protein [Pseudomonas sp. RIT 411]RAU40164.1 hypothetical protein DBY63_010225 [Pseudomonas sp. RIT 411]